MNIPKKIFTNEHLELFSSGQIRIPNKAIRIPQVTLQFWSLSSKFEEGDSNPSNSDSNPHSKKFRLTKVIRIPHEAIQIQSPIWLLRLTDSNPQSSDSTPLWRKKRCWEPPIRITHLVIRIHHEEHEERLKQGFESPKQQFESLKLELWRTRQSDSNFQVMDSNPLEKVKAEGQTKRFKISSYGFESLLAQNSNLTQAIWIPYTAIRIPLGAKFKSRSSDSNPLHSDSNS